MLRKPVSKRSISSLNQAKAGRMADEVPRTTELGDGIMAIDTVHLRPLFDASHLIREGGRAAFVDTGANSSVSLLLEALEICDVDRADVEYVFLTHVHLDHAGGAGLLMQALPNAKAVLHPRGAPHMIDPARLIRGAQAVYGEKKFAAEYGDIVPIPESRIIVVDDEQEVSLNGRAMQCIYTEGHARHHYVLSDPQSRGVFTGDSFGLSYRELDTANGEFIYPTTTPIHFDPPEAHIAIDRIMDLDPAQLFLTHYSRVTDLPRLAHDMHRRIDDFVEIAERHKDDDARTANMHESMYAYFVSELGKHGFAGSLSQIQAIVEIDVELNTMGLEYWLDHR
jgi:glyoxylase-like metal-dependent hydrolase (beta-lactamase superfamily II)